MSPCNFPPREMTDTHRKHHRQVKEKHSKGGRLTSLLLKLFNWNGWLLKKGIPKKLPPAEWSQISKTGSKDERLHMLPKLVTNPDENVASSAAIIRRKDPYYPVHTVPSADALNFQKPGVVARLMGLDYIPCSPSQKSNGEVRPQEIPTVAAAGERQHPKLKDVNLTSKVIEKSSKKVLKSKQLQQRQLARSLDMNLQKISKRSFLTYASKPLLQKKDIKRIYASPQHCAQPPSKSVTKSRSTQKNPPSKRATLLLEAAVKTLQPSLRSGDSSRPVLVKALVSRTVSESLSHKHMTMAKADSGKVCDIHATEAVLEKDPVTISSIELPSHTKLSHSQASGVARHQETQKQKCSRIEATQTFSDRFQQNKVNTGLMKKGHYGKFQLFTPLNILEAKIKAKHELLPTSQLCSQNIHNEEENAADETDDRLLWTGHERATTDTTKTSNISCKTDNANTKLSQTQHEDQEQIVGLIPLRTEKKPQKAEGCLHENLSICLLAKQKSGKDRQPGKIHQEVMHRSQQKNIAREVGTVQGKSPARMALADFSQQRNQSFSTPKHKSLLKTPTKKRLQNSCDLTLTTLDKLPTTLVSYTDQSLSLKENEIAGTKELVIDISPPPSTDPEENWKVYEVDKMSTLEISSDSSSEGHCMDDDINWISSECRNKPYEASFPENIKEQSQSVPENSRVLNSNIRLDNGKEVAVHALQDDHLEEILRSMLSMTIANNSSNEKNFLGEGACLPNSFSIDFIVCSNDLEELAENSHHEETQAPSITLEFESTSPSENIVTTPRCAEAVFTPYYIEDGGQPSPVSVLELPFEDEDRCSWVGEDYPTSAKDELHACRTPEPTYNKKSPSMYNGNLSTHAYSRSRPEIVHEAILQNLKNRFYYSFPDEDKINIEMGCMQYKATYAAGHVTSGVVQHQHLRRFATDETWMKNEGHSSKALDASNFYDKLLSDCAAEILTPRLSFLRYADIWSQPLYVALTALGERIVDDAHKQITIWSRLNLSTLNDLVDKDLGIPAENWTDFQSNIRETGAKLECIIFNELLDELVSGLRNQTYPLHLKIDPLLIR